MTIAFDPFSPLLKSDPYSFFRKNLVNGPIQRSKSAVPGHESTWYFLGFEEARLLLKSDLKAPLSKANELYQEPNLLPENRALIWQHLSEWPLFQHPPLHTQRRALIANAFRRPALGKLESRIRSLAGNLLKEALTGNSIELQRTFSYPLAVTAINEVLGLPPPDILWFKELTKKIADFLDLGHTPGVYAPGMDALNELISYVEEAMVWKRQHLSDDLLSVLLRPLDNDVQLENNIIISLVTQILIAGQETMADGIGNGVNVFAAHPDQLDLARTNPQLIENTIQEILRFDSPVQFTSSRLTTRDLEFGDVRIAAGDMTIVALGACNRDSRRFQNPDQFNIQRDLSGPELSFGQGIHYCVGVHFARMVTAIAFQELFGKLPNNWILQSPVTWRNNAVFRGPAALTLRL
jgi:cytochrome P450